MTDSGTGDNIDGDNDNLFKQGTRLFIMFYSLE